MTPQISNQIDAAVDDHSLENALSAHEVVTSRVKAMSVILCNSG